MTPILLAAALMAGSVTSAFAALLLLAGLFAGRRAHPGVADYAAFEATVFLFDDRELIDATPSARQLLQAVGGSGGEWDKLAGFVSRRIPSFSAELASLADRGEVMLSSPDYPGFSVQAEFIRGVARLTLRDMASEGQGIVVDGLSLRAQEEEIASLQELLSALPHPIWRAGPSGEVIWANQPYLALLSQATGDADLAWPLPNLFGLPPATQETGLPKRVRIGTDSAQPDRWYDCHTVASGATSLNYAIAADAIIKAETALRDFMQTLTRTFAHLPIGLAIFDRQRHLTLFNPALMELSSLNGEFLSARPTLFSFLDRLRDARIIPEPKDYSSWRQKIMNLEQAAANGLYEDTWSLATGQTYRVTGRPHSDGAVAFFIEDITAETSLTRRFRAEIEVGQSVIDAIEDAMVVFGADGRLLVSNAAYARLWGIDPGTTLGQMTVVDATRHWQHMAQPNAAWGDLRDFVSDAGERFEWDAEFRFLDGTNMAARIAPMPAGTTLVRFTRQPGDRLAVHRVRRSRLDGPFGTSLRLDA